MCLIKRLRGLRLHKTARRAGDQPQVSEADLAAGQRLGALAETWQPLADSHPIGRRAPAHVTVVADPMNGRDRSLLVIFLCCRKGCGQLRELELDEVDTSPEFGQVSGELRSARPRRLRAEAPDAHDESNNFRRGLRHDSSLRTYVPKSMPLTA